MPRILIIEDEPILRSSMARGIVRLPGMQVADAGTLGDAIASLDEEPPSLVISDIDLPDRSGIELIGELGRRGLRIPIIFVTGFLKAYRSQIPHHADVLVLEKPVAIEELRKVIRERLPDVGGDGPSPFSVPDYLQLASMGRHSVVIEVSRGADLLGQIVIRQGELWAASDSQGEGMDALARLAFAADASAACRTLLEQAGERNVEGPVEAVLLEAARLSDEARRSEGGATHPSDGPDTGEDAGEGGGSVFEDAWERGLAALLAKDYGEAFAAFRAAAELNPDDVRVQVNLKRLREMGFSNEE